MCKLHEQTSTSMGCLSLKIIWPWNRSPWKPRPSAYKCCYSFFSIGLTSTNSFFAKKQKAYLSTDKILCCVTAKKQFFNDGLNTTVDQGCFRWLPQCNRPMMEKWSLCVSLRTKATKQVPRPWPKKVRRSMKEHSPSVTTAQVWGCLCPQWPVWRGSACRPRCRCSPSNSPLQSLTWSASAVHRIITKKSD